MFSACLSQYRSQNEDKIQQRLSNNDPEAKTINTIIAIIKNKIDEIDKSQKITVATPKATDNTPTKTFYGSGDNGTDPTATMSGENGTYNTYTASKE